MLKKNETIGPYSVVFPIASGSYAETYRVKDVTGQIYFLKLINYAKLYRTQFDEEGKVVEAEIAKQLKQGNITSYHDSGEIIISGQKFTYIVFKFISGETVLQKISREQGCRVYDAKQIVMGVLEGLKFLHTLPNPIIHNELTVNNIMLDLSTPTPTAKIIDFGSARFFNQSVGDYRKLGLNPFYLAPEALNGVFSVQTDIFSVGAMFYHMIFGLPPYFIELSKYASDRKSIDEAIELERNKPLKFMTVNKFEFDDNVANIISKAIALSVDDRFKSVDEFILALQGVINVEPVITKANYNTDQTIKCKPIKRGNGFADIAGMQELKALIQSDVIELLSNPEEYKKYKLDLPNGILLYGPPGCGKTFFAEKFAEEVGFNFYQIKPSDIKSKWLNASSENVRNLFDEAMKHAPSIIFIDEIDAIMPNRESDNIHHENTSIVNEFLAQMNNAGEKGLFIIGATNMPNSIDPAILRAGRLEQKFYISPPDAETRKAIFELYLKNRPIDLGIDYDELSYKTEYYISADIKYLVDTASRLVIREKLDKITMEVLIKVIESSHPTISVEELKKHEAIRDRFEGRVTERKKIGF